MSAEQEGEQTPLGSGASPRAATHKADAAGRRLVRPNLIASPFPVVPDMQAIEVLPCLNCFSAAWQCLSSVASCDSDQILIGVFLATCGDLSASSSDCPP